MERLKDKIVLITGAAGAVGRRWREAVQRRGRARRHQRSGRPAGRRARARRHLRARLAARDRRDRPRPRPARRPGQRRRHRGARQHRGNRFRHLAENPAVNLDGTFLGCKHALALLKRARRLDRQRVVGRGPDRRAQFRRLQRLQGRRAAADQVGRAARRAARSAGALQLDPSGLPGRADGRQPCCGQTDFSRQGARARITRDIPLGRLGTPAEVADLCVYLSVGRIALRHRRRVRHRRRPDRANDQASCSG